MSKPLDPMDPRTAVDWGRVIENLRATGMTLAAIAAAAGVSKTSVVSYANPDIGAEPRHVAGEQLLELWLERTGYGRECIPVRRRPLSVAKVLRAHR